MIFYFSATGNSLKAAKTLAAALDEKLVNIGEALKKGEFEYSLSKDESAGFVLPVYFFGIPTAVDEFIRKLILTSDVAPYVFAVMTCGGIAAAAFDMLAKRLKEKGLTLSASFSAQMPDNYILLYPLKAEDEAAEMVKKAEVKLAEIAEALKARTINHKGSSVFNKFLTAVAYPPYKYGRRTKKFWANDKCTSCGLCEKICPASAIKVDDKPAWIKPRCVHCLACIHRCPVNAIHYGKATALKGQYSCPDSF